MFFIVQTITQLWKDLLSHSSAQMCQKNESWYPDPVNKCTTALQSGICIKFILKRKSNKLQFYHNYIDDLVMTAAILGGAIGAVVVIVVLILLVVVGAAICIKKGRLSHYNYCSLVQSVCSIDLDDPQSVTCHVKLK